ncbi:hypothetical protein ZOSMA_220G00110 [Zostera marina]|uniref:Uncharacterized protein n=1 Tax=Zostera marina TaxID=29655 RepID=A0A0K9PLP8_ZOSMR|nr:hypothetical protein ZOSMA_220G00110 [Zostera marina]
MIVISVIGCTVRNPEFGGILGASSCCSNHNIGRCTNDACNSFCQSGPAACRGGECKNDRRGCHCYC